MNKTNYKAAISGAHSQGKTTLINELKHRNIVSEYKISFLSGVAREVGTYLPINEGGTLLTQYMILSKQAEACLKPGRVITDRSVLDVISYTRYHFNKGDITAQEMDVLETIYKSCLPYYSRIFYIIPELPLVNDNVRSVGQEFFDKTVTQFSHYIKLLQETTDKVVLVKGSVAERIDIIEKQIKQDLE